MAVKFCARAQDNVRSRLLLLIFILLYPVELVRFSLFLKPVRARKRFGRVSLFRVWEAYENGYPHIHCLLFFESFEFNVFRDRKGRHRIRSKGVFERHWHSFVDVQAVCVRALGLL